MDQFEKDFLSDIRDKKKTASGSFHKKGKGKRHGIGQVLFTSDLLKGQEKRKYRGTSKVRRYNMYEKLKTREEFEQLTDDQKKVALQYWRNNYATKEIQESLGMAAQTFYNLIDKLDLPKRERKKRSGTKKEKKQELEKKEVTVLEKEVNQEDYSQNVQKMLIEGLNFTLFGKYEVSEIQAKLEKVGLLLEGEKNQFQVEIRIHEVEGKNHVN